MRRQVERKKSFNVYFSLMASFSIVIAGLLYFAYGILPHQYYIPASLGIVVMAGVVVYIILAKIVEL